MKQDYLWDKSGAVDPEIEQLENALIAFRYRETAPPALPAKVLAFPERAVEKPVRRRFSFAFAFAACAAAILITFGVLFQFSNSKTAIESDSARTFSSSEEIENDSIENDSTENDSAAETQSLTLKNVETSPQIEVTRQIIRQFEKTLTINKTKTNVVKIRQSVSTQNKSNVRKTETENPSAALTDEEKYAYDQLMLALSITGSKLKIVKDKVEGVEEQTAVFKDGR
jgi:hypothetical protein